MIVIDYEDYKVQAAYHHERYLKRMARIDKIADALVWLTIGVVLSYFLFGAK